MLIGETKMLNNSDVKSAITAIIKDYEVELVSIKRTPDKRIDVLLNHNIYYKSQAEMAERIRAIKGVTIRYIDYQKVD